MLSRNTPDLSYHRLARKGRHLSTDQSSPSRRIAILSDAASQQFVPLLRSLFSENGVNISTFEGAFDAIELEVFDPESELYKFRPDTILLAFSAQALRTRYFCNHDGDFLARNLERVQRIWTTLRAHTTAHVIHFNYAKPYERFFGNLDLLVSESLYAVTGQLNTNMAECVSHHTNITICDVDRISSEVGRSLWFDDRLWNMTKAFCRLEYLPIVCQNVVEIVLTLMGRLTKCLVLDLDNTLWGGIVGDQGHLGIDIGAHGDGEAFFHFQHYLLRLKKRGLILTVCSKNDLANALQPFNENPDMVLRSDDIAVFVANWDNKADNIRAIRDRLNIGFDSMVFIDDNPFERNLVKQFLPEVIVPELPEDPADYVHFLSALNLFETTSYSPEDAKRAEQYKQESARLEFRDSAADLGEYLRSLDMRICVSRFDQEHLARIAQLMQRSNQFNLTTRRLNEAECVQLMLDTNGCVPLYASLMDRFGDHGLISIVILQLSPQELVISDWLMSCRVLARGVEEYLMNHVIGIALQNEIPMISATYVPTAKNSMVKEFFAKFGFTRVSDENGRTEWTMDPKNYRVLTTSIREPLKQSG